MYMCIMYTYVYVYYNVYQMYTYVYMYTVPPGTTSVPCLCSREHYSRARE